MKKIKKILKKTSSAAESKEQTPRCGLCGKTKNLIKTDCCGQTCWVKRDIRRRAANTCVKNAQMPDLKNFGVEQKDNHRIKDFIIE